MSSAPDQSPQGVIHDEADEDVTSGRHLRTDHDRRNNHRHKDRAGEDKAGTGEAAEPALEMARYVALPLTLSVLAFIAPVIALIRAGREPSALVGRILDIIQGLSLTLLLPAATYGSGLFDLVWRKVL